MVLAVVEDFLEVVKVAYVLKLRITDHLLAPVTAVALNAACLDRIVDDCSTVEGNLRDC